MNTPNKQTDPRDNFGTMLHNVFIKRNFLGLAALMWGVMLGGGTLLMLTICAVALLHGNIYIALFLGAAEIFALLRALWYMGDWIVTDFEPRGLRPFLVLLWVGFLYSLGLPFFFTKHFMKNFIRASRESREAEEEATLPKANAIPSDTIKRRDRTTASVQRLFSRMAHLG